MLTAVKNQIKVALLSTKYGLMREMTNKVTFIMDVTFMILNNASFIIQWIILYSLKDDIGGYTFKQVLLLWGIAASTYGFAHFSFKKAFSISDTINNGKLDSYLVQPKNVLISCITSDIQVSAIGDILYGYIMLLIYGITIQNFILFSLLSISGGLIVVSIAVILGSLSFWIGKSDSIADTGNDLMVKFATYPDGIFKGITKILLFTLIPVGITTYMPVWIMTEFNITYMSIVLASSAFFIFTAFSIFNRGLKRYSSSNLMISKI
ncbi:MAG: ABC-2 family transporter protein [Clostridia bacterium]|nr:ABC-2 family transporter protein [Clostridia bacterium]